MEHSFDIEIAEKYGVNAAIIHRNLQHWIAKNKADGRNLRDGRTWSYNTLEGFQKLFPYMTQWDIRRALQVLLDANVIRKGNYNITTYDRTTWYAFEEEKTALASYKSHLCNSQMESAKFTNRSCKTHRPIPNPNTDNKPDNNNSIVDSAISFDKLDLDKRIVEKRKLLSEQIERHLHPGPKSSRTIASILRYFVTSAQNDPRKIAWFTDAIEWARTASISSATNKIGLFVAKAKQATGFKAQSNLLYKKGA